MARYAVGVHFDIQAVSVLIVRVKDGHVAGQALHTYVPGPLEAAKSALQLAMQQGVTVNELIGIGSAFAVGPPPEKYSQSPELPANVRIARPVSTARACLPGAGVAAPSTLVMVFGADRCDLVMNSRVERAVPGITLVPEGILPGYVGYETSLVIDHKNLVKTQAAAFGVRKVCDTLRSAGVPVRRFVVVADAAPEKASWLQTYADALSEKITFAPVGQCAVRGAAILGALAAGARETGHAAISQTIHAMAPGSEHVVNRPELASRKQFEAMYAAYCSAAANK